MNIPAWIKPAIIGAVTGAIALAIYGFSVAGWVSEDAARKDAEARSERNVVAALVPICLTQAQRDPNFAVTLSKLKDAAAFDRGKMLRDTGWATMPGSTEPNSAVSFVCMDRLAAQF